MHAMHKSWAVRLSVGLLTATIGLCGLTKTDTTLGTPNPTPRPCYIAVENKADYHYEVIESTILQFPLPWEKFNCSKMNVIVDVALAEHHSWAKHELEPWKNYFNEHLKGTARPRTNGDGAIITFGSIQKYSNYSRVYDAYIGVSCDTFQVLPWMNKGDSNYCVLHGTSDNLPQNILERVCWLNPMHPRYFIPSDLPQFPREKFERNDQVRICLKASSPESSFQFVVRAVQGLEQKDNITVVLMGRVKKLPEVFDSISNLVGIRYEPDYYKFQREMSKVGSIAQHCLYDETFHLI